MNSPSDWVNDRRIDAVRRWLARYQPFLVTIVAIALIAILLPGRSNQTATETTGSDVTSGADTVAAAPGTGATTPVAGSDEPTVSSPGSATAAVNPQVLTFAEARKRGVKLVANCDPATGKIKVPSRFAPPCTQAFTGVNGGNSYKGVTSKTINVVWIHVQTDPASDAILRAAGVNDSDEEVAAQVRDWTKYYESHYNLWGRKVKWTFVRARGEGADTAAARADAIDVANKHKAFAVINAPNNTFVNEMVARKIICHCTVSQPMDSYIKWYPYVWTSLLASSQGYIHRATYVARLLKQNAIHAYDDINPTQQFKTKPRKFGFIWYETDDHAYASGAKFFMKYMKEKYGVDLYSVNSSYLGYPDHTAETQEQARPIIQKMKNAGVTSILCVCDPFAPIFFTREATNQLYGPEWIVNGSALTDTSFFARLYEQNQWSHAFGVSYLGARLPEEKSESYRILKWQFNHEPPADSYGVIGTPVSQMFLGLMMAGPVLTPRTFAAGFETLPIRGRGGITTIAQSYGNKGIWPWKIDPVAFDDATEIWWDRGASGEDEIGQQGTGLYRYVNMGKRYLVNEWPKTRPFVFNTRNTITIYNEPPPADKWPCYPSPATKKMDRC